MWHSTSSLPSAARCWDLVPVNYDEMNARDCVSLTVATCEERRQAFLLGNFTLEYESHEPHYEITTVNLTAKLVF